MVDFAIQTEDEQSPTYSLRVDRDTYPDDAHRRMADAKPTQPPVRRPFHEKIEEALWSRFSFDEARRNGFRDHDHLAKTSSADLGVLLGAADDVGQFVETLCDVNTEFTAETEIHEAGRDEAMAKVKQQMLHRTGVDLRPGGSVWGHDLDAMDLGPAITTVGQRLRSAVKRFVERFVAFLDAMVAAELVGLIKWELPGNCDISFFREIVIQQGTDVTTIRSEKRSEVIHAGALRVIQRRTMEVRQIIKGEHEVRHARYDMELRNAGRDQVDRSKVLIPQPIQPLIEALPEWLRPLVELVDGERYSMLIVAEKVDEIETQRETVHEEAEIVHSDVLLHFDPAIVVDRYVLTGWGPEEADAEQQRRDARQEEAEQTADAQVAALWFWPASVGVVLAIVLGAWMTALAAVWAPLGVIGPALGMIGGVGAFVPLRLQRQAWRKNLSWPYLLSGTAAAVGGSFAVLFAAGALARGSWLFGGMSVLSIVLSGLGVWAAREAIH